MTEDNNSDGLKSHTNSHACWVSGAFDILTNRLYCNYVSAIWMIWDQERARTNERAQARRGDLPIQVKTITPYCIYSGKELFSYRVLSFFTSVFP